MQQKKAVVAGHICVDITPIFTGKPIHHVEDLLLPGKLINTNGVTVSTGGVVANTGLAMKILGANVSLVGKIGDDSFGKIILDIIKKYEATADMIVSDSATSYSVVLALPGIDRIFLHDPGSNDTFCSDDLPVDKLDGVDLFHFGYPPIMKRMFEDDGDELVALLQKVHDLRIPISLDLAAVDPAAASGQADWKSILTKALPLVDFFVPSAEELCYMLDPKRYANWEARANGRDMTEILTIDDIRPLAEQALNMGVKVVLIKCGVPGMYCKTASAEIIQPLCDRLSLSLTDWADQEIFEASYIPDVVRSGTGAGDTSIAAFLTAILREESLAQTLHMAAATGACCVTAYDSLSGLMTYEEIQNKINNGWKKRPQ